MGVQGRKAKVINEKNEEAQWKAALPLPQLIFNKSTLKSLLRSIRMDTHMLSVN